MSSPAPPAPPAHLPGLDVLRAVACLWVVLYHVGMWWLGAAVRGFPAVRAEAADAPTAALLWLSQLGFQGVSLFLVLSGFCLYYPLARRGVATAEVELGVFARRRARRILPAYYASIALLWTLSRWEPTRGVVLTPVTPLDLATHLTLTHNLHPETIWTMNGAYWTLALEAQLYLVFPALVAVGRRAGAWGLLGAGLGVSVAWPLALGAVGLGGVRDGLYGVLHESLPARLGEFSAGMAAAALFAERRPVPRGALLGLLALVLPASHAVHVARWVDLPVDRLANALGFGALLLLVARARPPRALPGRALAVIGLFSYSLYLVHQPALLALRAAFAPLGLGAWPAMALGAALSLGLGALFFLGFERPFLAPARRAAEPAP